MSTEHFSALFDKGVVLDLLSVDPHHYMLPDLDSVYSHDHHGYVIVRGHVPDNVVVQRARLPNQSDDGVTQMFTLLKTLDSPTAVWPFNQREVLLVMISGIHQIPHHEWFRKAREGSIMPLGTRGNGFMLDDC